MIASAVWRDLIGQSDRWGRTILYAVVIGRLSILAIGLAVFLAIGDTGWEEFSGLTDKLDLEWMFNALILAPIIESLGIALLVFLVGHKVGWGWPVWATALVCAILAIPLHGLSALSLAVAPFFALMAAIQHHWMAKGRSWTGLGLITLIHFIANAAGIGAMSLRLSPPPGCAA